MTKRHHHEDDVDVLDPDGNPSSREGPTPRDSVSALAASGLTVTVANPTPPTNIAYIKTGTPPVAGAVFGLPNTPPTLSGDAALFPVAGVSPVIGPASPVPAGAVAITAIAAPVGGSGPAAEATGSVVVDTAHGGVQSVTVMGNYTNTPNASHPSSQAPVTPPTITSLAPASTPGTGGTMLLTVTGTGFQSNSIVAVNGVAQATNFVSATTLEAPNAPKRTSAGTSPVTVVTGGTATAATNWTFT